MKEPEAAGNPEFNIANVKPTNVLTTAPAAITEEDLELDRMLERVAAEEPPIPTIDPDEVQAVKKEPDRRELLSDVMDVQPASTVNELMDQVHLAKEMGCDSVEATPAMVRHYCRRQYPDKVGFFMFHDIKVYIAGFFEEAKKRSELTIEDINFGAKK